MIDFTRYPEHAKLENCQKQSQVCGEFLEWLQGKFEFYGMDGHEHVAECRSKDGYLHCGVNKGQKYPAIVQTTKLLAEFFGINERKLQAEKDAMLRWIRAAKVT